MSQAPTYPEINFLYQNTVTKLYADYIYTDIAVTVWTFFCSVHIREILLKKHHVDVCKSTISVSSPYIIMLFSHVHTVTPYIALKAVDTIGNYSK